MGPIAPVDILYGHRASMKAGNLYMAHRCGFTKKVLIGTFRSAGFYAGVNERAENFDLWAIATKGNSKPLLISLYNEFVSNFIGN